jgi:hypothetical protein
MSKGNDTTDKEENERNWKRWIVGAFLLSYSLMAGSGADLWGEWLLGDHNNLTDQMLNFFCF